MTLAGHVYLTNLPKPTTSTIGRFNLELWEQMKVRMVELLLWLNFLKIVYLYSRKILSVAHTPSLPIDHFSLQGFGPQKRKPVRLSHNPPNTSSGSEMPVIIFFIFSSDICQVSCDIYVYISLHCFLCLVMSLNQESSVSKHPLGLPRVGTYFRNGHLLQKLPNSSGITHTKTSTLESALNQCTTYHL